MAVDKVGAPTGLSFMDTEEKKKRSEGATGTEDITQRTSHGSIGCAPLQPQGIPYCESPSSGDIHFMALYCLALCLSVIPLLPLEHSLQRRPRPSLVYTDLEAS